MLKALHALDSETLAPYMYVMCVCVICQVIIFIMIHVPYATSLNVHNFLDVFIKAIANLLLDIVKVYINKLLRVLKPLEKYNKHVTKPCTNVLLYI